MKEKINENPDGKETEKKPEVIKCSGEQVQKIYANRKKITKTVE